MSRLGLSARQVFTLAAIGVALWYGAALLLHWLAAEGLLTGQSRAWVYALSVPGTVPFVLMTRWLAGLAATQVFTGVALVTMTALLIDGVVVAWIPQMYGDTAAIVLACSGAVLWGAGVGLAVACLLNRAGA